MSKFDLDAKVSSTATGGAKTNITSYSLCTPGCRTGALACFTRACNPTGGCHFTK